MATAPSKEPRQCPGEPYTISEPICRARQRRHYPKCMVCPYGPEPMSDVVAVRPGKSIEIFKSHSIRGLYSDELDEEMAQRIGAATAQFLDATEIVVGRDMRESSLSLTQALMEGIISNGTDVVDIGTVSTEMSYFAVGFYKYGGCVMTTGSCHPSQTNGFKICREKAVPLSYDTGIANISKLVAEERGGPDGQRGRIIHKDAMTDYRKHVRSFMGDITPLRVVVDAGNGMAGEVVQQVLDDSPCEIIPLYFELDGSFPNHEANPLVPENLRDLQEKVAMEKADFGVAFDGDADRCVFVDENGAIVPCDLITAMIAKRLLQRERGSIVIYDLRSSWVVAEEIKLAGGLPSEERVGHAYIKAAMRRKNAIFGSELSGHYYFRDSFFSDSAMLVLVEVMNILSSEGKSMSEVVAPLRRYHATGELSFDVEDKDAKLKEIEETFSDGKVRHLDGVTVEYEDWWFNVRKSSTEARLHLNLEGKTDDLMATGRDRLTAVIKRR